MPRFFVPPSALVGDLVTLEGEQAAHAKALRLAPGEEVILCDGAGTDYRCTVSSLQSGQLTAGRPAIHALLHGTDAAGQPLYGAFPRLTSWSM